MNKEPRRLTKEKYMSPQFPLRIFRAQINGHLEAHWHDFYEIHFILSGRGTHILNGNRFEIGRGDIFLLTPADFHEIISQEEDAIVYYNLLFSDELLKESVRQIVFPDTTVPTAYVPEEEIGALESEFKWIEEEFQNAKLGREIVIQGALDRILTNISRMRLLESRSGARKQLNCISEPGYSSIGKALSYIQYHFREPLTLKEVAFQSNMAPNYFSACFTNVVGITFQRYIQDLRLHYAKSLLTVTNFQVTEICYASGFHTLSHFERAFKLKYGNTPRGYRKKHA